MYLNFEPYGDCTLTEGNVYLLYYPKPPKEGEEFIQFDQDATPRIAYQPGNMEGMGLYFRTLKVHEVVGEVSGDTFDFFKDHLHKTLEELPEQIQRFALLILLLKDADIFVTDFTGMDEHSRVHFLRFLQNLAANLPEDKMVIATALPDKRWSFQQLRMIDLKGVKLNRDNKSNVLARLYGSDANSSTVAFRPKPPEPSAALQTVVFLLDMSTYALSLFIFYFVVSLFNGPRYNSFFLGFGLISMVTTGLLIYLKKLLEGKPKKEEETV